MELSHKRLCMSELRGWGGYVPDPQGQNLGLLNAQQACPPVIRGFCGRASPEDSLIEHQAATHTPEDAMQDVQRPLPRLWYILSCTGFTSKTCLCLYTGFHLEPAVC